MKIPFLLGLTGIVAAVIGAQASSADSLLDNHTKALQKATTLDADYTVQALPGGPVEYKLKLAKPSSFRFETPDEVLVGNGTTVWDYKKADNSYTETLQASGDVKKLLSKEAVLAWTAFFIKEPFKEATSVKVGSKRVIKGNPVTEVTVALPGKPDKTATFFIDDKLGIARGFSLTTAPDKQTIVMAKDLTITTGMAKDTDFTFSVPSGAKKLDPSAVAAVGFDKVAAIFQANCAGCHNSTRPRSGLDLTSYAATMTGGRGGKIVTPGDADNSPIMAYLKANGKPAMPPNGSLSDADIATIAAWIKAGAKEN